MPDDEVEDVLQRVFLQLWRSRDRFDPDRSLRPWVFAIARSALSTADSLVWAREVRLPGPAPDRAAGGAVLR